MPRQRQKLSSDWPWYR